MKTTEYKFDKFTGFNQRSSGILQMLQALSKEPSEMAAITDSWKRGSIYLVAKKYGYRVGIYKHGTKLAVKIKSTPKERTAKR